jgi:hypothetical protein
MLYFGRIATVVVLSLVSLGFAADQIYTYRDNSGALVFTTELDSIPEKNRSQAVLLDSDSSSLEPISKLKSTSRSDIGHPRPRVVTAIFPS